MKEKLVFKRSQEENYFLRSESSKMEGMLRTIWRPIHLINCAKCDEVEPNKSEKRKKGQRIMAGRNIWHGREYKRGT